MEFLREHWYIVAGVVVLLYFAARSGNSGSLVQTRAGTDDVALAQLASAEREADEARRFGVATQLLQYDVGLRGLTFQQEQAKRDDSFQRAQLQANTELARLNISQQVDIANIYATSQNNALNSQYQLAQLQASSNNYANQLQYQMAQYTAQRAYNDQRRNDWLGAITSGIQTILPTIFGNSTSGGGMNIPSILGGIFGGGGGSSTPTWGGGGSGTWQTWPN